MAKAKPKYILRAALNLDQLGIAKQKDEGLWLGFTQAWHKTNWFGSPFAIANELIAGEVGRFLRLPLPPFAVTQSNTGTRYFSSLDFNFDAESLPPVDPELCWRNLQQLCVGVICFDVLIANCDRHNKNLAVDNVSKPLAMRVFDHDQALLGGGDPSLAGAERLAKLTNRLGISGQTVTGGNRHCLLDVVDSAEHFGEWEKRIDAIPNWLIDDACFASSECGIEQDLAEQVAVFLKLRRDNFKELIRQHRSEFSAVTKWTKPGNLEF